MAHLYRNRNYWVKVVPQIKHKLSEKCKECGNDELYLTNPTVGDEVNEEIVDQVCNECHWYESFSVEV